MNKFKILRESIDRSEILDVKIVMTLIWFTVIAFRKWFKNDIVQSFKKKVLKNLRWYWKYDAIK